MFDGPATKHKDQTLAIREKSKQINENKYKQSIQSNDLIEALKANKRSIRLKKSEYEDLN